jgi:hypothetical protein
VQHSPTPEAASTGEAAISSAQGKRGSAGSWPTRDRSPTHGVTMSQRWPPAMLLQPRQQQPCGVASPAETLPRALETPVGHFSSEGNSARAFPSSRKAQTVLWNLALLPSKSPSAVVSATQRSTQLVTLFSCRTTALALTAAFSVTTDFLPPTGCLPWTKIFPGCNVQPAFPKERSEQQHVSGSTTV